VFSYIEVNFMKNASVDFTVIDDVIRNLDPTPDYVGISLSSLPDYTNPADPTTLASKISELLDYAAGKLVAKEGVEGPRVVISDAAFPLRTSAGVDDDVTGTQELQVNGLQQHAWAASVPIHYVCLQYVQYAWTKSCKWSALLLSRHVWLADFGRAGLLAEAPRNMAWLLRRLPLLLT
jgi:hypothetical protein